MWRDLRFALSYLLLAFPLLALVAFVWPLPKGTEPLMVFVWAPLAASLAERVSRPANRLPLLVPQLRWSVLRSTVLVVALFSLPVFLIVGADPNLSHRAEQILSQGWKPTLRGSAVDKCRFRSASLTSSGLR